MSGIKNSNNVSANNSQPKDSSKEPPETSGVWVALLMVGLLAFMLAVELIRSKA